jgi:DNA polymerase III delta subunit
MKHIHFVYGNQLLEIKEEIDGLIDKLLPPENKNEAVFYFDIEDFFTKDQNQNRNLLGEFKNTCETVSFFSPVILVCLKNLQELQVPKKKKDPLEKELERINLVKLDQGSDLTWFDGDTLLETTDSRYRLTGKQIVKKVRHISGNRYSIVLEDSWVDREVVQIKGDKHHSLSIKTFLMKKLEKDLQFETEESSSTSFSHDSDGFYSLLYQYLKSPPPQVELVLSANIKNTREINKGVYSLIKQNAKEIKKTIAYDDFKPVSWVMERARSKGLSFNQVLADLLIEIAGSDYSVLNMELEKLSVLNGPEEEMTPEILLKSVSQSKKFTRFRISDYLAKKDLKNSLECLGMLLEGSSTDYVSIFSIIAAQFRRLLKISWMLHQAIPEQRVVEQLGINQWIAKQLIKQTTNFTTRELENLVVFLSKCDVQLKYSSKDAMTLLENICFLICRSELRHRKGIKKHWLP